MFLKGGGVYLLDFRAGNTAVRGHYIEDLP